VHSFQRRDAEARRRRLLQCATQPSRSEQASFFVVNNKSNH
jgi:hypothetical protein